MNRKRGVHGQFNSEPTASVKDRFEAQYVRVPIAGCWIWTGPEKTKFGYGAFKLGARNTKVLSAHRAAWEIYIGEIPSGMCICHSCDNPACVNPDHLFLGTHADNVSDKVAKGRNLRGSKVPGSKITESIALKIKTLGESTKSMAQMFGISRQSVADIVYGRTWKHV